MALSYLNFTNRVLQDLNETTLTALSSSRGVQTVAKNSVNRAINDIANAEIEWPFLHSDKEQDTYASVAEYDLPSDHTYVDFDSFMIFPQNLVTNGDFASNVNNWTDGSSGTGAIAYNSTGPQPPASRTGVMRLTAGGDGNAIAYQALTTTKNKQYRASFGATYPSGGDLTFKIGTSADGSQISSNTVSIDDLGEFKYVDYTFSATGTTTYITFSQLVDTQVDVDNVVVTEDFSPKKLKYISYDEYQEILKERDRRNAISRLGEPDYVYRTQDEKFGLSPVPNKSTYTVGYEYWKTTTVLSSDTDTSDIPARYEHAVIARARYYVSILRSDLETAQASLSEYNDIIRRMRIELVNKKEYFRAV
jgi:hypothetical protein|tara:strand:+ start:5169 stop:6257 length:1089 start_codon:yes stop_codon:yes gene_type:complete